MIMISVGIIRVSRMKVKTQFFSGKRKYTRASAAIKDSTVFPTVTAIAM